MAKFGDAVIKMEGGIVDPDACRWECNCEKCKEKYAKWKAEFDAQQAAYLELAEAHRLVVADDMAKVHIQYETNKITDEERADYMREAEQERSLAKYWRTEAIKLGWKP